MNFQVPSKDVKSLFGDFKKIAKPLGVVMNTERTRILKLATGPMILPRTQEQTTTSTASLSSAIATYSHMVTKAGTSTLVEVTTGL